MDNLTHSLVGLAIAESVARMLPADTDARASARRSLLLVAGMVASNVPDADLLVSYHGFERSTLAYLLQHRGYTHTVIGCAALALLLYGCGLLWARYRGLLLSAAERAVLAGVGALGVTLHLGMDALNSYGVHPFWPIDNRWFYGDSVFIIEPLYWLAAAPLLLHQRALASRVVVGFVLLMALAAGIAMHLSEPAWWAVLIALTVGLLVVGGRLRAAHAALGSAAAMLLLTVVLVLNGRSAARSMAGLATAIFPAARTHDTVLTPMPMNPGCWDVLLVQTAAGRYTLRHGIFSTAAAPERCPRLLEAAVTTAPLSRVDTASSYLTWLGEFSMPQERLALLAAQYCAARELLQFARAPFATRLGSNWVIGDLRFDREAGLGLAEIELHDTQRLACLHAVPWVPPRAALINPP